ncbi:MAG: DUF2142 domain-containing protein [Lachnospiraceae bacterium]|jgi:uncharacterized membrane protein|nr:DUF2142 domain-containing protein [Lachnospiraceae bacterium]
MKFGKTMWVYIVGLAAVALLGVHHMADVSTGARATGQLWLNGAYATLFGALVAVVSAMGAWVMFAKKPRPALWCALAVFFLGLGYSAVLPAFSSPDEYRHFVSAYKVANVLTGVPGAGDDGLVYIRKADRFLEDTEGVFDTDAVVPTHVGGDDTPAVMLGYVMDQRNLVMIKEKLWEGLATGGGDVYVESSIWPVNTTPAAYIPQALGIALAKICRLNPIWLAFLGRLGNLLFFAVMVFLAVRAAPGGPWLLAGAGPGPAGQGICADGGAAPGGQGIIAGVALLPMVLSLAGSMSYDVMILGISFLLTAWMLSLSLGRGRFGIGALLVFAVLAGVLAPIKIVYIPLAGLGLLIPAAHFANMPGHGDVGPAKSNEFNDSAARDGHGSPIGSHGKLRPWMAKGLAAALVCAVMAVSVFLVGQPEAAQALGDAAGVTLENGQVGYSLPGLLRNPLLVWRTIYDTFAWTGGAFLGGMLGSPLGQLDPVLNVPFAALAAFGLGLLIPALAGAPSVSVGKRIWAWTICGAVVFCICFSMLLANTPVGAGMIRGIQGRYFLPVLPLFLFTLRNRFVRVHPGGVKVALYGFLCLNAWVLLRLFAVVCLRV